MKHLIAAACACFLSITLAAAESITFDAKTLFARSTNEGLRLGADGNSVELDAGVLIEDDGPAAGYSYKPSAETLKPGIRVRKTLLIPASAVRSATLLVASNDTFAAEINGSTVSLTPTPRVAKHWTNYRLDPAVIKPGPNEIVLYGTGQIWIARDDEFAFGSTTRTRHPNRSAKSADGGKTWNDSQLGTNGDMDGEYGIRLFLDQHRSKGTLLLPVVDLGNLGLAAVAAPLQALGICKIDLATHCPDRTRVTMRMRSGPNFVIGPGWTDWQPASAGVDFTPSGRYLQIALDFESSDALKTPHLKSLTLTASTVTAAQWTSSLRVLEARNAPVTRTSLSFNHEPYDHPSLIRLRKEHQLDGVVKSARSELEIIELLAAWTATRWKTSHLAESYPKWNALDILATHRDGSTVGGFCQQYSVVFLQACAAFGIPGRIVSLSQGPQGSLGDKIKGSGHEITEIWSNEHRKWIYIDAQMGWYMVDSQSQTPLSLLELNSRQRAALTGEAHPAVAVKTLCQPPPQEWKGLTEWPPFQELRLIPRSNFLEAPAPLPLNQGMRGWFWSGHILWGQNNAIPRLYETRVCRRADFEWDLNTVHLIFEGQEEAGMIRVHADTETPHVETMMAKIDDGSPKPVTPTFIWQLHGGRNRLEVFTRNRAGRDGSPSFVVIERP